jgi:hypothetical protein
LTGHEGSLAPFKTEMRQIDYSAAGLNMSQVYAFAMTQYYCWEDPDSDAFSNEARYKVKQAMDWATEFGFITTIGSKGNNLTLTYQDSTGKYNGGSYTGNCDGYIKTTIGSDYEAMKLYREVVWKSTNMRTIPSFAVKFENLAATDPIQLYWDEEMQAYTTTISDSTGTLKYFDFQVDGVTCTDNGDGTLTITSKNEINGELINTPIASKLEPSDGVFKLPTFYRWYWEGKSVTFKYAALAHDIKARNVNFLWYESGDQALQYEYPTDEYYHSHFYTPACNWTCLNGNKVTHCRWNVAGYNYVNNCPFVAGTRYSAYANSCTGGNNAGWVDGYYATSGYTDDEGEWHDPTDWVDGHNTYHVHTSACHTHTKDWCHEHDDDCKHKSTCPNVLANKGTSKNYSNVLPTFSGSDACSVAFTCMKKHVKIYNETISGTYIDWQDHEGVYADGEKLIDPTYAYIKVTTVPHEFPAETDVDILLIAENSEWNNLTYTSPSGEVIAHADHIRLGERYKLIYVYSYKGGSKGFYITSSILSKPYYQYNYLSRMQAPNNTTKIYDLRGSATVGSYSVPYAKLEIKKTKIKIYGSYTTLDTAYPKLTKAPTYQSGNDWDDSIYLDALTEDQFDDNYNNKSAKGFKDGTGAYVGLGEQITSSNANVRSFEVSKAKNNEMQVVWTYETDYEIFSSAMVKATAYIWVDKDVNDTTSYYDEAYNYANDQEWGYSLEDHNNVGGRGYFSSEYLDALGTQSNNSIPAHVIYTQNNEYLTYAVDNKVYQSDIDIYVKNIVLNTGAGITEHTYYERGNLTHPLNYNLYYTIVMENPKATIYENKLRKHDNKEEPEFDNTTTIDTTSDEYEFDVNTNLTWHPTGSVSSNGANGNTIVVDHIRGGAGRNTTYIQREIPVVLTTLTTGKSATMYMGVDVNTDQLIYEDHYRGVTKVSSGLKRTLDWSFDSSDYSNDEGSTSSAIYAAMNPNNKLMQPKNITASANVPNNANDEFRSYSTSNGTTSFTIMLSNGTTQTVKDSNVKSYTQYDFKFNTSNGGNKVTFPSHRSSVVFFKYSKTSYNGVAAVTGDFSGNGESQRESYYFSQILFKSNYTTKYQKELEEKGANYIIEKNSDGSTNAWIDMVNQNEYAIVAAGQGFELKVTVKYENTFLTQYLARYKGFDDAQSYSIGTSSNIGAQYCNISSMTGFITNDGKSHSYINGINTIDRLASQLVTGSNVYKDLYCYMSDNPDVVYSYSGIYDTPVIFDRSISYSKDYSVTTITYTMCKSAENGVASTMQNMKFYTNQLAPDSETPGIVYNSNLPSGKHSITLWTPIVAATGFDYPSTIQDRYIGDAIEIGYTIKTTAADDSIVHIVQ